MKKMTSVRLEDDTLQLIQQKNWRVRELIEDGIQARLMHAVNVAAIAAASEQNRILVEKIHKWATRCVELENRVRDLEKKDR